jgi:hypothetical protein
MLRKLLRTILLRTPGGGGEPVAAADPAATHSVVLRLDPAAMQNADLEVRWDIEKALRARHPDLAFYDDGYGFARHSDAMLLSYATSEADRLVAALVDLITHERVSGYDLAKAATVAVAPREPVMEPGQEWARHRVVFPPHQAGGPVAD